MKKIVFLSFMALFSLVSCTNKNTPEYVAKQFITAMNIEDYKSAKLYTDEKTGELMDFLIKLQKEKEQNIPKQKKQKVKTPEITITKTEEKGNTATVHYYLDNNKNQISKVELKKIKDQWKVSINKEGKENEPFEGGDLQQKLNEGHDHNHDHSHDHHNHDHSHQGHNH